MTTFTPRFSGKIRRVRESGENHDWNLAVLAGSIACRKESRTEL